MKNFLPDLWTGGGDPFRALRREMNDLMSEFGRRLPSTAMDVGQAPPMNVAETKDAVEIAMELPGLDEQDVSVTLEGNRLVVSGEHKEDSDRTEKDWRIVERRSGAFYRAVALPWEPKDEEIDAHFDKGVLKLRVKRPAETASGARRIAIGAGPRPESDAPTNENAAAQAQPGAGSGQAA